MQKGLDLLLNKYSVGEDAVLSECGCSVSIGNGSYPILPWEAERRFIELRNIYASGRVGDACTCRIAHTAQRGSDLKALLYRELGILSFILNSDIKSIFAIRSENCMNAIAEAECGCIATIELAASLKAGEEDIDKHELICEIGVACDRVVDTQIPQHSIYLFGEEGVKYRDTDAELYGYSELETSIIRSAFKEASSKDYREECCKKAAHIQEAVRAAEKSIETLENVKVGC